MSSALNISLAFAGRDKELAKLKSLYAQRRHVLISGPKGIGKSALVNQVRFQSPLLVCEDTTKLSRICDSLERQFGWTHSRLNVLERKNRLLAYIEKRGESVAFDQVSQTTPRIARFMAHLSAHVPVWIVCRSESPHDIGRVWEYLSDFVRVQIAPLNKADTRVLIAQAVSKGTIRSDALNHVSALFNLSKGNPRLLEELLIELSAREYKMETSFGRCLLALDQRIQEFETDLASQATENTTKDAPT
jgi:hypothetical protein